MYRLDAALLIGGNIRCCAFDRPADGKATSASSRLSVRSAITVPVIAPSKTGAIRRRKRNDITLRPSCQAVSSDQSRENLTYS